MQRKKFFEKLVTLTALILVCMLPLQSTQAGGVWSALGGGVDGNVIAEVYAIVADGNGNIYAGGYFTTAGGVSANNAAKWNGTSWSALGSGTDNVVYTLALDQSGNLYAGGDFEHAGGNTVYYIAKWDGASWSAVGPGFNGDVNALAVDLNDNLYAGGHFSDLSNGLSNPRYDSIAKWDGNSWSPLLSGTGPSGHVNALALDGNTLYAGGDFAQMGDLNVYNTAKWNGSSWSALGSGTDDEVNSLAVDNNHNLYVGGYFTQAGGITANRVAKWNGSSWSALGSGTSNGTTSALATDSGGNLYAGGDFYGAGGITAWEVAKWDGSSWSALGSGMTGTVWGLTVKGNNLYAGGQFNSAGDNTVNKIAKALVIPVPSLSATSLNFGNQLLGTTSGAKTVVLTNNGCAPLNTSALTIAAPYKLISNTCSGKALIPAETCTFKVAFIPTMSGATSGKVVTIPSNASTSPNHVALSGNGVTGTQLLTNTSFEIDGNNDRVPDGWGKNSNWTTSDGRNCTMFHSGNCSLKFTGTNLLKSLSFTVNKSGVAGNDFNLSLWRKALSIPAGATLDARVQIYNLNTLVATKALRLPIGTYSFTKSNLLITMTTTYTKLVIFLDYKGTSGSVWFDDVTLNWAP